ncbi:MAG: DUF6249 domain-containing protein [Bacteroidota bacterium]
MDVAALGVMVPIISVIGIIVMVIYLRKYSNEERMAIIEKGLDPAIFIKKSNSSGSLRASLLLIGGGIGLLLGYALDENFDMEEVGYFAMLFICGGIGLGAAYIVEERKAKNQN